MDITILCGSEQHPINDSLIKWKEKNKEIHHIDIIYRKEELQKGDILFLISYPKILGKEERSKFKKTFVIHASDLPNGRGWSPHIWELISGCNELTVTLLEAGDEVDAGDIWKKNVVKIPNSSLHDEIDHILFQEEIYLMDYAINNFENIQPTSQKNMGNPTYYRKRTPADSEIDPYISIAEQFNLIRVCNPDRYPAFLKLNGHTYQIQLKKIDNN